MENPPLMWAQNKTHVFITVKLQDVADEVITFAPGQFTFKGTTKNPAKQYDMVFELFAEILPEDKGTKYNKFGRYLQLNLRKKDSRIWWPRLAKTEKKLHHVRIDWEKWIDDQSDAESDDDGFEIPNAADSQMTSSDDSDSDVQEEPKIVEEETTNISE